MYITQGTIDIARSVTKVHQKKRALSENGNRKRTEGKMSVTKMLELKRERKELGSMKMMVDKLEKYGKEKARIDMIMENMILVLGILIENEIKYLDKIIKEK